MNKYAAPLPLQWDPPCDIKNAKQNIVSVRRIVILIIFVHKHYSEIDNTTHVSNQNKKVNSSSRRMNCRATWQIEGKWNYLSALSPFYPEFVLKQTPLSTYSSKLFPSFIRLIQIFQDKVSFTASVLALLKTVYYHSWYLITKISKWKWDQLDAASDLLIIN
jgi:hypothetical protein